MAGIFDEDVYGAPVTQPASGASAPSRVNIFDEDLGGASAMPKKAELGRPFGELKAADPSWTQWAKWKAQDALMGMGMQPYPAGHVGGGIIEAGKTLNPVMGSVLSAADLTHDVGRGSWGDAAWDAAGALPGAWAAKGLIKGAPKIPMADVPRGRGDASFLPERGTPDPHGMGPYGVKPVQPERANDELQTAASSAYRDTRYAPVDYHPLAMNDFTARAKQSLEHPELGFSPEKAPLVHATLDRWVARMEHRNTPISASDWDGLRQQLKGLEGADGVAGQRVAGWIDQYMVQPPPGALIRGTQADLDQLQNTFDVARGNYRSYKTAETVEKEIDRAGTRAGSKNSGLNTGNMTRDKLGALTNTDAGEAKIFGARPDERAAINAVVAGDPWTNRTRDWSNKLGGGGGIGNSGLGVMAGAAATSGAHLLGADGMTAMLAGTGTGLGVGSAGTALRRASNERTVNAADDVVNLIRKNSPEYEARLRATPDIVDPAAMARDAIAYALMPQVQQAGKSVWDQAGVPYENRE